ncbi:LysR family transcriptional regulator [Bacillus velezensis]|uniref:LysR family transcriptional regulator n=1 Tax=Bacillus TaxID=1386 RepID=UPI0005B63641|nr:MULTISPECIES: LysR family transcriptional regulator [Bacillus]ARJ76535.1 LysR family transcriptional regulator [Bacillus velezensis]ATL41020.1 LysR family transcriptional regulator [Bacillus velezensis]AWG37050.1 LysR family transcriptional regulator [Bacillus velezensis]AWK47663.1 LysR family transcriptional regulator [Bacillus velezensis]KNX32594.1 LysR family transcriptional regulator [Bacillus amyloliquefaciens]
MDEKDWIVLITLFEEKNMTKAAERLYMTQPALSYRLKNLEAQFGVRLFYKRKKGMEFTSEGEHLVDYSKEMLQEFRRVKDDMLNMSHEVSGVLRLGVSSNFAQYKLPAILKRFSDQYPSVQFHVNTGWSAKVMDLLHHSGVHLGIMRGNYDWQGEKQLLNEERLYLISKTEINSEDLPKLPMIYYQTDASLKSLIQKWWNNQFTEPPFIAMEVDRQETCKEMVKNGLGYSVVPEICLQPSDELYTLALSYKNNEPVIRDTWLMYNSSALELSVVKAFITFLNGNKA